MPSRFLPEPRPESRICKISIASRRRNIPLAKPTGFERCTPCRRNPALAEIVVSLVPPPLHLVGDRRLDLLFGVLFGVSFGVW